MGLINKIKKISLGIYIAGSVSLAAISGRAIYNYMDGPIRHPEYYSDGIFVKETKTNPYGYNLEARVGTKIGVSTLAGLFALTALLSPLMIYQDIQEDKKRPKRISRGFVDDDSRTSGESYPFNTLH